MIGTKLIANWKYHDQIDYYQNLGIKLIVTPKWFFFFFLGSKFLVYAK